jgi:hypothetical protein
MFLGWYYCRYAYGCGAAVSALSHNDSVNNCMDETRRTSKKKKEEEGSSRRRYNDDDNDDVDG